jgi:hypothetical protein
MVTDLAASPVRAITSAPPARVLRLAIVIGAAGLVALLSAVGVLVWTYTGVKDSDQQTIPSDISSAREVIVPKTAAPSAAPPAPAPPAAPAQAAALPPGLGDLTSPGGAAITQNPAAGFAPTAPRPISAAAPSVDLPTIKWPTNNDWATEIARNVDWSRLFWSSPSGNAATGAIIGAATSTANNAINLVGNSAVDVFNTLLLINSGYYDGRGGAGLLQAPVDVLSTLSKISLPAPPSLDLTKLPSPQGLPQLPPPPNFDPRKLPPPPNLELPKPPKLPSITKMIGLPF